MTRLLLDSKSGKHQIAPEIYGHFAEHLGRCVYEGFWVGEDSPIPNVRGIRRDVVEALKKIKVPVLRWPGGCFADEYHWQDGIGDQASRGRMLNTHWGMVVDDNAFGTHEFMDLCGQLGSKPYIAGNVGSGTVEEMQDWVEYLTADEDTDMVRLRKKNGREEPWQVPYFGVGNENWGCGGNMTPEYYADVFRRYQTYVRNYGGNRVLKVACGPNGDDLRWTKVLMEKAHAQMDALALHYYVRGTGDWQHKGSATEFDENEWFALMKNSLGVEKVLDRHLRVMDRVDPKKRVALYVDEWGTWWDEEPGSGPGFLFQQNTLRDAVSAAVFLNAFNNRCERIRMANIAQINNVLQAMVLTKGSQMLLTPTYHVFEMYKVHQGGTLLPLRFKSPLYRKGKASIPALSASASRDSAGALHLTVANLDPKKGHELVVQIKGSKAVQVRGRVLTHSSMTAHNTFDDPETLTPQSMQGLKMASGSLKVSVPPKSVAVLTIS